MTGDFMVRHWGFNLTARQRIEDDLSNAQIAYWRDTFRAGVPWVFGQGPREPDPDEDDGA